MISFQDLLTASSVQQGELGKTYIDPHGRTWVYCKDNGSASTKGYIQTRAAVTGVDTVSSSTNGNGQIVFITEASAGWTVDQFADDWVIIDDGTGSGQHAKIKTNTADTLELYPEHALGTALAVATSDITIGHPYKVITATAAIVTPVVGAVQVTQTASYFVWLLKKGFGLGIGDAAPTAGAQICPSSGTAGEVLLAPNGTNAEDINLIGYSITPSATDSQGGLYDFNC